jgi:hypothetical protein
MPKKTLPLSKNAGKTITHHIFSSLWSGLKSYCSHILDNCTWQLGIGNKINFWLDSWCGKPLATTLQIPNAIYSWHSQEQSSRIHC